MMNTPFEDEYLDVLQNIEFGIIKIYQEYPELTSRDADKVIEGLVREYTAELKGRAEPKLRFSELQDKLYGSVRLTCDWRLGRAALMDDDSDELVEPVTITVKEMITCLKRIRKSIKFWTKEAGRRGYLDYVSRFIAPEE